MSVVAQQRPRAKGRPPFGGFAAGPRRHFASTQPRAQFAAMAAYVGQRDREIAFRMALGATTAAVRRFVVAEAVS